MKPLIHLFSQGRYATALCDSSNADDNDAPASEDIAEVTCTACLREHDTARDALTRIDHQQAQGDDAEVIDDETGQRLR